MGNNKVKIVIYGNCQSVALINTLFENEYFKKHYELLKVPMVQAITEDNIPNLLESVRIADVFIYQHVKEKESREKFASTDNLLNLTKSNCTIISFPSLYFSAINPFANNVPGLVGPIFTAHDYFFIDSFLKEEPLESAVARYKDESYFSSIKAEKIVNNSLTSIKEREIDNSIDIKLSSFIENNIGGFKLFNYVNHPSRRLINELAYLITKELNNPFALDSKRKIGYIDRFTVPAFPSIKKFIGLKEETIWTKGQDEYDTLQIAKKYYDFYSVIDKKILINSQNSKGKGL
jgi:hypothetical protein